VYERQIADGRCSDARLTVSAGLDQEAAPGELLAASLHLATCPDCRLFCGRIDSVSRVLRSTELLSRTRSRRD